MGRVRTEADKPYPNTDIANISFISTEDQPGQITAQITREAPPVENINLGVPEKARGRLNWLSVKNGAAWITKMGIGALPIYDGAVRLLSSGDNLGLAITGACEAISGTAMIFYSYRSHLRTEDALYSTKQLLDQQAGPAIKASIGITPANDPKI